MSRPVRFGYKLSAEQFGPSELLDFTRAAEECGFDTAAISDHFQPWRHTGGHAPFSFSLLRAAGQATQRILLGTSVVTPTFRCHPAIVAQAMGTLGCLFPGRVWLGVGTGESMNEAPLGIDWPDSKERFARLKEAIELSTDPALRRGLGTIRTSGKGMELYASTLLPSVLEGARTAQRDPAEIDLAIEMKVSFDTDRKRALEDTRNWVALALSPDEKLDVEDPLDMERLADALPTDKAASRWIVSADADEHVERIRPYLDLGFTHLIFHAPGSDQHRFLELYSRDILPRLRRLID